MKPITIAALVASLTVACPPTPPEPHVAPVGDAGQNPAGAICQHLAALKCAEGVDVDCVVVVKRVLDTRIVDLKPACLLQATTKSEVRACGQKCE
jgi:hypothetical protein